MAESDLTIFCRQVRKRSKENGEAIAIISDHSLMGILFGILRQELDSLIRCIFLLSITDIPYREKLISDSVNGIQWRKKNSNSKITDREMVDLGNRLHDWTESVYKFGCSFIHLSALHDYSDREPLRSLSTNERTDIASHLAYYHGFVMDHSTTFRDLEPVLPKVFKKIADNLEYYVSEIESGSITVP